MLGCDARCYDAKRDDNGELYYRERRHITALTWDAMFRSRGAILADGGGVFDSVTVWRPSEVGCSVAILTVVITRVCRKPGISSVSQKKKYIFNFGCL